MASPCRPSVPASASLSADTPPHPVLGHADGSSRRSACDQCRARKLRCDRLPAVEGEPPQCRWCYNARIVCTTIVEPRVSTVLRPPASRKPRASQGNEFHLSGSGSTPNTVSLQYPPLSHPAFHQKAPQPLPPAPLHQQQPQQQHRQQGLIEYSVEGSGSCGTIAGPPGNSGSESAPTMGSLDVSGGLFSRVVSDFGDLGAFDTGFEACLSLPYSSPALHHDDASSQSRHVASTAPPDPAFLPSMPTPAAAVLGDPLWPRHRSFEDLQDALMQLGVNATQSMRSSSGTAGIGARLKEVVGEVLHFSEAFIHLVRDLMAMKPTPNSPTHRDSVARSSRRGHTSPGPGMSRGWPTSSAEVGGGEGGLGAPPAPDRINGAVIIDGQVLLQLIACNMSLLQGFEGISLAVCEVVQSHTGALEAVVLSHLPGVQVGGFASVSPERNLRMFVWICEHIIHDMQHQLEDVRQNGNLSDWSRKLFDTIYGPDFQTQGERCRKRILNRLHRVAGTSWIRSSDIPGVHP